MGYSKPFLSAKLYLSYSHSGVSVAMLVSFGHFKLLLSSKPFWLAPYPLRGAKQTGDALLQSIFLPHCPFEWN